MDSGKDYLKYLTERLVRYVETPKTERKMAKAASKESWQFRWFGMLPVSFRVWTSRWDRRRRSINTPASHENRTSD